MLFRHEYQGGVWVDLEHPTEEEVRSVAREFSISEHLERELYSPTPLPIAVSELDLAFLVLHFPAHGTTDGEIHDQELDFVVGDRFIITVRYEVIAPLHHLKKLFEAQELVATESAITTDMLLELLFVHLYNAVRDHTSHIAERASRIERDMFNGLERETVRSISNVSREFLHIEAALANQVDPLNRFLKAIQDRKASSPSFTEQCERILAERTHLARLIATYRSVATELRETNASLLELRQNEIMKTLTVITFVVLPLELITFIFSMHALGTPLEQNPNAFWIILGIMFIIGIIMITFLFRKRWLF